MQTNLMAMRNTVQDINTRIEERKSKQVIIIKIKEVYGNTTYYPICESAKVFATMLGQKTLTAKDLANIQKLGYEIQPEQIKF
jgi:hypothetical protein